MNLLSLHFAMKELDWWPCNHSFMIQMFKDVLWVKNVDVSVFNGFDTKL